MIIDTTAPDLRGDHDANHIRGCTGDDRLVGNGGHDTLIGGAGNDTLSGDSGNDRFVFHDGTGDDRITDFQGGSGIGDLIDLSGNSALNNFAEVQAAASQVGVHTVIDMGGGSVLTLDTFTAASLASDDFIF